MRYPTMLLIAVLALTVGCAGAEREKGRAQYRYCLTQLDTVESRCIAASPNHCTLNAAEYETLRIQRENQARLCKGE